MKSAPLLEARNVVRRFPGVTALAGVSLAVERGELVGLIGPDGAGKTTLIRALTGLIDVNEGEALVGEIPWTKAPEEARDQLGYMPQQFALYGDLSVDENLYFFGQLFGLSRADFSSRRDRLLGITQLTRAKDRPAAALSGGMYKKLAIACALLHRPEVLVLDEPTNGVDPVSRREVWALLYEFVSEGMGVLVSTPYMDEAARCGRVCLLSGGKVLVQGEPSALVNGCDDVVLEAYASDRGPIDAYLEAHEAVIAVTPAGERIRALVTKGRHDEVQRALEQHGARVVRSVPDFEDLYFSLEARAQRERAAA
ncbi:MAG: ABC transporter ATP-binding protein [Polyangiaceae bacterium]